MLLSEDELKERTGSPMNLLNRLNALKNKHKPADIPALPPTAAELIPDIESKIQHGAIKSKAMGLITQAMDELKHRIPEVNKPQELATIASQISKVLIAVEPKQEQANLDNAPKIIIYAPRIMTEETYNVVDLNEI
jgi:hypothetical protein